MNYVKAYMGFECSFGFWGFFFWGGGGGGGEGVVVDKLEGYM